MITRDKLTWLERSSERNPNHLTRRDTVNLKLALQQILVKTLNYVMNIKFCICANVLVKDLTAKRLFQSLCQNHRLNFGSACMSQQLGCNCMFSKNCSNFSIKSYLLVQKTNFQLLLFN